MTELSVNKARMMLAVAGGSAVVAIGVLGVAIGQDQAGDGLTLDAANSVRSTGVTITQSAAPSALATPVAVPSITGPAPLPAEEQGLPG